MIVYKISNDINGKLYIGITTCQLEVRWKGHLHDADRGIERPLYRAMRKYGKEHFKIEQIDTANTPEELGEKERYYIK